MVMEKDRLDRGDSRGQPDALLEVGTVLRKLVHYPGCWVLNLRRSQWVSPN
jgi:hypothetical protein